MNNLSSKISHIISIIIMFFVSGFFYFNFKGFTVKDGQIVLDEAKAQAYFNFTPNPNNVNVADNTPKNGIATILPKNININASHKYANGSSNAPLTMYEYSSLGCPHCATFHLDVEPQLERDYVSQGLLRIVFVNFPLDRKSMQTAMISQCLTYENYFDFINKMFNKQRYWYLSEDDQSIYQYASEFGLSYDEATACMHDNNIASMIIADKQQGMTQLKITGTPAFLFTGSDGNEIVYGVSSYSALKDYIDTRLNRLYK